MYSLSDHRRMVSDAVRVDAYARAIAAVVRPGDVVLDLGCGLGIFSVLAARAGARRVYAVDVDDAVHYARRVVEANGVADQVEVIRGRMEDVTLPEPVDVIIGDLRGVLPLDMLGHTAWTAAQRHLKAGGRTIPRRDVVMLQPVSSEMVLREVHRCVASGGVALDSLAPALAHSRIPSEDDESPWAEARPVFEMHYDAPLPSRYEGHATFVAKEASTLDALLVGFEVDLAPGVSYRSFGPGRARAYSVHLLPTSGRRSIAPGTHVTAHLAISLPESAAELSWAVDVGTAAGTWQGPCVEAGRSLDVMKAAFPSHRPAPDRSDDLDALVLDAFRRAESVAEATAGATASFAGERSGEAIEARVIELARRRQARVVRRILTP